MSDDYGLLDLRVGPGLDQRLAAADEIERLRAQLAKLIQGQFAVLPSDQSDKGLARKQNRSSELTAASTPCRIHHHDGAYKCYAHNRMWGAVSRPDEPCAGWEAKPERIEVEAIVNRLRESDDEAADCLEAMSEAVDDLVEKSETQRTRIAELGARLADAETSLRIWDGGDSSEYWVRYPDAKKREFAPIESASGDEDE